MLNGGAKKEFYLSSLVQYVICDDEDTAKKIEEDVKEANPEAVIVKVSHYIHYTLELIGCVVIIVRLDKVVFKMWCAVTVSLC